MAKCGTPSNALERIASNIQENSTNLNEPREFYSNLFTQFLDSKNVNDNDNETEMKKLATFDRPLNIKEETEESEELEHTLVKNQSKVNDFTHSVINHYTLPEHHEKKNYKNLRRNKTIVI
jgi:exonuclease VII large subunit